MLPLQEEIVMIRVTDILTDRMAISRVLISNPEKLDIELEKRVLGVGSETTLHLKVWSKFITEFEAD